MRQATRFKLGFLAVLVLASVAGAPPFASPAYATNCTRTYCDRYCSPPCTGFMYSCNGGNPICGCRC
jgi:hypothetical protein